MYKKITLLLFALATLLPTRAQSDGWSLQWHGFVTPVLFADTRQVVSGREGMMLFYPKPVNPDDDGNDLNAEPSLNMLSITARLNLTIQGPDVLGAKTKGFVEGDYTGATDGSINMFRLRHAYIDLRWQKGELLMGQYWYPLVVEEIMPGTQPLNMGAPFHPYARYTQIRGYYRGLGNLELMGVAAFQLDNKSQGPEGSSTVYLKRSMLPELNFQLRYVGERLFAGAAANLMWTVPHNTTINAAGNTLAYHQKYFSYSLSLFGKYRWDHWTVKAQTLLNDNLYEGCTMGGYLECMDTLSVLGSCNYSYKPFTWTTAWVDFSRNTGKWRPALFLGYGINNNFGNGRAETADCAVIFNSDNSSGFKHSLENGISVDGLNGVHIKNSYLKTVGVCKELCCLFCLEYAGAAGDNGYIGSFVNLNSLAVFKSYRKILNKLTVIGKRHYGVNNALGSALFR